MKLQVQDIIRDAMGIIGAIEMDENPSASEMMRSMRIANTMLARWSTYKYLMRALTQIQIPLQSHQGYYRIGETPDADVIMEKPVSVDSGFIRDAKGLDVVVDVIPIKSYEQNILNTQVMPASPVIAYDPGETAQDKHEGTIFISPPPAGGETLIIRAQRIITQFENLNDEILVEPIYYEAIIYNLAVRLFRHFHVTGEIPIDVMAIAANALKSIETTNATRFPAKMDIPSHGRYNVYTD